MKRGFRLAIGIWAVAAVSCAVAQQWDPRDPAPWHLRSLTRLPYANLANTPGESAEKVDETQPRFLHIALTLRPQLAGPRFHTFRLTDRHGRTLAEVYGFDPRRSLLVFEGDWRELSGVYLDGLGHREPLEGAYELATGSKRLPGAGNAFPARDRQAKVGLTSALRNGSGPGAGEATGRGGSAGTGAPGTSATGFAENPTRADSSLRKAAALGASHADTGDQTASADRPGEKQTSKGVPPAPRGGNDVSAASKQGDRVEAPSRITRYYGGSAGGAGARKPFLARSEVEPPARRPPPLVLYLSCRGSWDAGTIYQVDETGRILGAVGLPDAATGLASHWQQGLVAAIPPHRGKVVRIDPSGRVAVLLENDPLLVHPVDLAIGPNSDTVMVADNVANLLAASSMEGQKATLHRRLGPPSNEGGFLSLALDGDRHVLLGTDGKPGIYRLAESDQGLPAPVLSEAGGVAADPFSLKWAAAQPPNEIRVYEGDRLLTRYRVPDGQRFYRRGLLSFAADGSIITVVEPSENGKNRPRFIRFGPRGDAVRTLFRWEKEPVEDFVVGPRMPWDEYTPPQFRSRY